MVKQQLESKVQEQSQQIEKLTSLEMVMIRQMQLTERMEETIKKLEMRVDDKEELKDKFTGHMESTVRKLETRIVEQNKEIDGLRTMLEQLCVSL